MSAKFKRGEQVRYHNRSALVIDIINDTDKEDAEAHGYRYIVEMDGGLVTSVPESTLTPELMKKLFQ